MTDIHAAILDCYFWAFLDQETAWENTPLFKGIFEGESLAEVVSRDFGVSLPEANTRIELARTEVAL